MKNVIEAILVLTFVFYVFVGVGMGLTWPIWIFLIFG